MRYPPRRDRLAKPRLECRHRPIAAAVDWSVERIDTWRRADGRVARIGRAVVETGFALANDARRRAAALNNAAALLGAAP